MMIRAGLLILALAVPSGALGQATTQPWTQATPDAAAMPDVPPGYPYNVGAMAQAAASTDVPLRDYISSRLDQQRVEMLDRVEQLRDIVDERDRQYAQRFAAQQEALSAAALAAEKAVSSALAAAKEAVSKAENAASDKFESVNEFRGQLDDQADTFMPKAEASVRFTVLEDKINQLTARVDATKNIGQGRDDTWAFVIAGIVLIIAIAGFALNYSNRQKAAA